MLWGKEFAVLTAQGDQSMAQALMINTSHGWKVQFIRSQVVPVQKAPSGLAVPQGKQTGPEIMAIYSVVFWRWLLPWRTKRELKAQEAARKAS